MNKKTAILLRKAYPGIDKSQFRLEKKIYQRIPRSLRGQYKAQLKT